MHFNGFLHNFSYSFQNWKALQTFLLKRSSQKTFLILKIVIDTIKGNCSQDYSLHCTPLDPVTVTYSSNNRDVNPRKEFSCLEVYQHDCDNVTWKLTIYGKISYFSLEVEGREESNGKFSYCCWEFVICSTCICFFLMAHFGFLLRFQFQTANYSWM